MAVEPRDHVRIGARASLVRALVLASLAVTLALTPGCQTPRTEVIVAVDADPAILALIDSFRIEVTSPGGETRTATSMLSDGQPLPRTLGLYWTEGSLGPYRVVVSGLRTSSVVTMREARFSFVRERTLVLRITLVGSCLTTLCPAPQVCGESGCRDVEIAATELEPWTGTIERRDAGGPPIDGGPDAGRPDAFVLPMDAGRDAFVVPPDVFTPPDAFVPPDAYVEPPDAFVPPDVFTPPDAFVPPDVFTPPDAFTPMDAPAPAADAFAPDAARDAFSPFDVYVPDGCTVSSETCNMRDDDCDTRTDEGFDLTSDEANCGMCGSVCTRANATPLCNASSCEIGMCNTGFDDCNGNDADGCEINLRTDRNHCGGCGDNCTGGRMCCNGMCRFSC